MKSPEKPDTPQPAAPQPAATTLANQIIDLANASMESGVAAADIAQGLRHAAANFSAYAFFRLEQSSKEAKDPNYIVEDFLSSFEYYLGLHQPQETAQAAPQSLAETIAQAKKEL